MTALEALRQCRDLLACLINLTDSASVADDISAALDKVDAVLAQPEHADVYRDSAWWALVMGAVSSIERGGEEMRNYELSLAHGAAFPYDGGVYFWGDKTLTPPPAVDWAHAAARGVIASLLGRPGIKHALEDENIDHETRAVIVRNLTAIIRHASEIGR